MMMGEIIDVECSDVEFLETLRVGENSVIFKVKVRGQLCAMKVHHGRPVSKYASRFSEWDLFVRESTAYRRLKEKGLCDRGVVPDFYGTITNIQSAHWPSLHYFHEDKLPANAILIEYIPNMHQIDLSNFSDKYLLKFRDILSEINRVGILHDDTYPRNMMISSGEQAENDRVLWIDFDSAQTLPLDSLSQRHKEWFQSEARMMQEFVDALTKDHEEGKLNHAWHFYYHYS